VLVADDHDADPADAYVLGGGGESAHRTDKGFIRKTSEHPQVCRKWMSHCHSGWLRVGSKESKFHTPNYRTRIYK
jgi:hypothetical protein